MNAGATAPRAEIVRSFDDARVGPATWSRLVAAGGSGGVFSTWHFLRTWWSVHGRGELLLVLVHRGSEPVLIAPLFADGGMVFPAGSGSSDYLDWAGDVADLDAVALALLAARDADRDFVGFRLYHLPDDSATLCALEAIAPRLGLDLVNEGWLHAPALGLAADPVAAEAKAAKDSLLRHERRLVREGDLAIDHLADAASIAGELPAFFAQHVARRAATSSPSLFESERERRFYTELAALAGEVDWLRFTRVRWNGRPIAYHFGFCHGGIYLWYKPSFAIDLARYSPGEVLLRHLLLQAIREGAHTFDLGLGEEPFKLRFADRARRVTTWGLYPGAARGAW
jgi:CelD/BcsL family acetyltransferase involved in cellulose biosynthesis